MTDTNENIWARFQKLRIWKRAGTRAPYKPMLAIWAIGRCLNGKPRLVDFATVHVELSRLVRRFGPHRRRVPTAEPFWRLQNDGVWEIEKPELVSVDCSGSALVSDLRQHGIMGGMLESDYNAIREDPDLAWRIATFLLADHFPDTLHDDILRATGFFETPIVDDDTIVISTVRRRRRDSRFRADVLSAYDSRCAVCEQSLELHGDVLALEAAHIRWHTHAGPSEVRNGLSLCVLHHKLFDGGAFTLRPDHSISVSNHLGGVGSQEAIEQYSDSRLLVLPEPDGHKPALEFLQWHRREVFRA